VQLFQQNTDKLTNPATGWSFQYGLNQPHGWSPYSTAQLVTIMARYMAQQAPARTNTSEWLGRAVHAPASPAARPAVRFDRRSH
jgi:hypothetical protein